MSNKLTELITTFFYSGLSPVVPGTVGSFVAGLLCLCLYDNLVLYIGAFIVITVLGFMLSGKMEGIKGKKDPSCVVIDEAAGMFIAMFLLPMTPLIALTAFFMFRVFDVLKVFPVNRLENIGGGAGIMLDDLMAGVYANLSTLLIIKFVGIY